MEHSSDMPHCTLEQDKAQMFVKYQTQTTLKLSTAESASVSPLVIKYNQEKIARHMALQQKPST